jgi:hypothetical protein
MSQNPLSLKKSEEAPSFLGRVFSTRPKASIRPHYLLRCSYVGFRFMRYQASPWLALVFAPLQLLCSSGLQRTHQQIRYLNAISKINFVALYRVLNDLLW